MAAMSSSMSDVAFDSGNQDYGSEESSTSKSPLNGFGIFKGLTTEKKLKADGSTPKRRGPKPDSKPALTRRQELNRQAQRTHRERKELYIKALEQEVLRLKETYGTVCRDRDVFAEENRKLRELLASHGIHCPADLATPLKPALLPASSSGSFSGSYAPPSISSDPSPPPGFRSGPAGNQNPKRLPQHNINVDQVGINFVLALERPCMDHMQMLCVRSQGMEEEVSGHALMATCPPVAHIIHHPEVQYPHQISNEIPGGDLLKLLDLSARLPLAGEITPVMAWAYIFRDPRFRQLDEQDIFGINTDLLAKVRCYGFGAVLEEFEVKDALENVLAQKMEMLSMTA